MHKEYLGDGVYAEIEAGMIKLTTEDGDETQNTIFLEVEVYEALQRYATRIEKIYAQSATYQPKP